MTTINNPMRRSAPGYVGFIATVLLLQFALVSWTYPVTALWSDDVQLHIDSAYHWYELTAAVNTAQTGSLTGYDPFFNAGYPLGLLMSGSSARFASALAVIFRHW